MKQLRVKRPTEQQRLGSEAEELAALYLTEQGLQILQRNFLCKLGELDLIAQDKESLVFVEVRFRRNSDFGGGLESITPKKQASLRATASIFLRRYKHQPACRFDIISLTYNQTEQIIIENWIKNAF